MSKAPLDLLLKARDRGSRVHELCQLYDYDALPDEIDADCIGYLTAYKTFCHDYSVRWLFSEYAVGSKEKGYAGTIDRLGYIDGKLTIVDLKTSAKVDKCGVSAQLYGYNGLLDEPAELLMAVQLKKDGKYRVYEAKASGKDAFAACLTLNNYMRKDAE